MPHVQAFDEQNNLLEDAYYGADGRLLMQPKGYAKVARKYDARRNRIETAFYDQNGQLKLQKDGYARWTKKFDDRDNEVEAALYGEDNNLVLFKGRYAGMLEGLMTVITRSKKPTMIPTIGFDCSQMAMRG